MKRQLKYLLFSFLIFISTNVVFQQDLRPLKNYSCEIFLEILKIEQKNFKFFTQNLIF